MHLKGIGNNSVSAVIDTLLNDTVPNNMWPVFEDQSVWKWTAKWEVNEEHWLSCAVIMPEYAKCEICGKRKDFNE
jgi:hypothetical protein